MFSLRNIFLKYDAHLPILAFIRNKTIRLPKVTKSLEEKFAEMNAVDESLYYKIDIGLPPPKKLSLKELNSRRMYIRERKSDAELERKSRHLELNPDLDSIRKEWLKSGAPSHIQRVANHYKIFDHLFGEGYFTPYVTMEIFYLGQDEKLLAPVYWGNIVTPTEAFSAPVVNFESEANDLWTLTLVNPDGHFEDDNMEYIHWFIGNIPGGNINKGEVIWDYLPPFPSRGIGYQRLIFVLYKQEEKINYSKLKTKSECLDLKKRSFNTLEFYRGMQDHLTPAGLSFFQSNWDKTSRKIFHEILNMEEPVFEYDFDPQPLKKQVHYPYQEPFNLYLDRYRDPRDINQEFILKKLKEINPFEAPKKVFPYPKALRLPYANLPSWLQKKEKRYRAGIGRVQNQDLDHYE